MKLFVASDLHGSLEHARQTVRRFEAEGADRLILLGDLYYQGIRNMTPAAYEPMEVARILNGMNDRLLVTRGNCDSDVDRTVSDFAFADYIEYMTPGGKIIGFQHGDRYNIDCPPKGKVDALLYGHYHTGFLRRKDGVLYVNVGSVAMPKGGTPRSYVLIENETVILKTLEGEEIGREEI